jgi:hypothetical protein
MTVAELIEKLKAFDGGKSVGKFLHYEDDVDTIDEVYEDKGVVVLD